MIARWQKIVFVLGMAGLMVVIQTAVGRSRVLAQTPLPDDCQECHASIQSHWETSAHGQAVTDPVFQEAWEAADNPLACMACHTTGFDPETSTWAESGIACAACHDPGPNASHHPEQVMPTDVSSRLCGTCHVDTHAEWAISAHGEGELSCNRCHNPHTTELKTGSVQELCIACHNEESYYYEFTAHAAQGMLCTDCHLKVSDSPLGEGHGQRQHTFMVDLTTCNECHDHQMHSPMQSAAMPSEARPVAATANSCPQPLIADGMVGSVQTGVAYAAEPALAAEPAASSGPLNYLVPAGFGLVFGMMLAPLMERLYRRRQYR